MRKLTVGYAGTGQRVVPVVPMVRLKGQWLQRSGWKIGDRAEVEVQEGLIVIRKAKSNVVEA